MKLAKRHPVVKHDSDGTKHFAPKVWLHNNFNHDIMIYGGVEFAFWAVFAVLAFTSAYLAQEGFSSSTVGVIMALVSVAGIIGSPIIGNIADRMGSPRRGMIICGIIASIFCAIVPLFIDVRFFGVSLGVVFILLWAFFSRPMQGLLDGWVVTVVDKKKTFTFGSVRYFGSISYAIVCIIFGKIAGKVGSHAFTFWSFGILCLPLLLLAWKMRGDDAYFAGGNGKKAAKNDIRLSKVLNNYYLVMFLFCHCFVCMPMSCSMTFVPYKLMEIVGETSSLGGITAIRALAEIPMLIGGSWIVKKIGIKNLFIFDMILFLASQLLFIFAQNTAVITLAMYLMGTAYGAHLLGQVNYVYRITPHEAAASAQSLAVSFSLVASVLGNLVGGVLVDVFSTSGLFWFLFALEAFALTLFLVTFPLGRLLKKKEPDLSHIV